MPLRTLSGLICSEQIVEKFGIQNSPFLLSCKISEYALLVVIELHLDLGGDKVLDKLFRVSTKFDFIRFAITCLTDGDIHGFVPKDYDFKALFDYLQFLQRLHANTRGMSGDKRESIKSSIIL